MDDVHVQFDALSKEHKVSADSASHVLIPWIFVFRSSLMSFYRGVAMFDIKPGGSFLGFQKAISLIICTSQCQEVSHLEKSSLSIKVRLFFFLNSISVFANLNHVCSA